MSEEKAYDIETRCGQFSKLMIDLISKANFNWLYIF